MTNGTHAVSAVRAASQPIAVCGSAAIAHPSITYVLTVSTLFFFPAAVGFEDPSTPMSPPCSSGAMLLVSMMNTRISLTPKVDRFERLSGE
ncbi:hypothetical protein [Leifsonia sp. NCR5]|uniref:hypothetical protein n=1 Tax=Leifsonia sp. NCR5 TaxID=1978342 RepID=UPI00117B7F6B|nr:hypothetical protein [Leifsonia sp. NCR5]